ncbi:MAG TPA: nitroreductase family protein [Bacteroidales bacterium]|nr:nitroreductase family protein [Bacteroidales bacterium]
MEFTELINARESVRNYDPVRPVPKEIIARILNAGRIAPSAKNLQPWKFIVISSSPLLEKVKECYRRDWIKDAPHILVAIGLKEQAWIRAYDGYNSVETDVTIAMTYIILAAENEGVGACWIAAFNPSCLSEVLKPDDKQVIYGMIPLGYPKPGYKKTLIKKRKSLEEIVEFL